MRYMRIFLLFSLAPLLAAEPDLRQSLYLVSKNEVVKGIEQYTKNYELTGKHDFQILEEIGHILLEKGAQSRDLEDQLIALFGISLSQDRAPLHLLESGMKSPHPLVQAASLHLLAQRHENSVNELIAVGLKSNFIMIRFEALHLLVARKAKNALGYVEALSNLLDPRAKPYFVDFYASFGSTEALQTLKRMISDKSNDVRIASILSAMRYGRDDLLPNIRTCLTHADPALKETAAFAIGKLRDLHSLESLRALKNSHFMETRVAALFSLSQLGDSEAKDALLLLAENGNPYAISLCAEIPQSESILVKLLLDEDLTVVLNASLSLLALQNKEATQSLLSFLTTDVEHEGYIPFPSPGRALMHWKPVSLATLPSKEVMKDVQAVTLRLQEEILRNCVDLPEESFLFIAKKLLQQKKNPHISLLTHLLENRGTPKALTLLEVSSKTNRSPLVRTYSLLSLYRNKETPERKKALLDWVHSHKDTKMLSFKPMMNRGARPDQDISNYELSPEETSGLFIEIVDAFTVKHDEEAISLILKAMREGHEKNRTALAGLLLKSIQ